MARDIKVTLAGQSYTVEQLPMGRSRAWREKVRSSRLMAIFENLDEVVSEFLKVADSATDRGWANVNVNEVLGVVAIVPTVVNGLMGSIDEVTALLYAYAPDIAADQERIDAEGYDDEAVAAFCEVLKLALPFTELLGLVRGRQATQTSRNSRPANGATGTKKRTAA